jgi:rod shape-determining protein MreC
MRNVFLFIRRYFNLVFFLALQVVSLMILFRFNKFHESVFSGFSNEVTGSVNTRFNSVETYFTLKKENEALREQNAQLLNKLKSDFYWPDSTSVFISDTIRIDSLEQYRKFLYLPAKIISNSVNTQQNFLMLHRGSAQGVTKNMAVVGASGIVGTVVSTSRNMCVVMSLLHRQTKVVAVLKKGSGYGEISWDGKDPAYVTLLKVPKTVSAQKGDTVVTSQFSDKYPPGYIIGTVESIEDDPSANSYKLKVKTATDFFSIQHAFIVKNLQRDEVEELERSIKRNQ